MPRKRKKSTVVSRTAAATRLTDLSLLDLVLNPVALMLVASLLAIPVWNRISGQAGYVGNSTVSEESLRIAEVPGWIRTSIAGKAIQQSRLNEVALGDPRCLELVASALATQSSIKSVDRLAKLPDGIEAIVTWRTPAGLVEFGDSQLVPVDETGTILDGDDLAAESLGNYLRISVPEPTADGLATGRVWNDLRIQDAALIACCGKNRFSELGLTRIVNRGKATSDRVRIQPYELWTARGTIVYWGSPPGQEKTGEASAASKIEAIEQFVRDNGPLDQSGSAFFDVRDGVLLAADPKLAEQTTDFIRLLK